MVYKHFWYTFEARPPFRVVGVSSPFTLPSQLPKRPSIQFATGLLLNTHTHEVIVSCGQAVDTAASTSPATPPGAHGPTPTSERGAMGQPGGSQGPS